MTKRTVYIMVISFLLFNCKTQNETLNKRVMEINKNYMFCLCMGELNIRYENKPKVLDGSSEVYFINDSLKIDIDKGQLFVKNYLDSINQNNIYRSYNNNSLIITKCLDFYNSKKLKKFLTKEIDESK